MSKPFNLFIPITKVDVAQRLVYGLATAEKVDRSGEVCDYATTKPYYEKWSEGINKATDGKSFGNIRAMHGKVAAGKITAINFNDDDKQIEICAKVIDDNEWNKVEQGVYTGFSQGGGYVKRWKDGDVQKYTADPHEVSLVDLPCLDASTFDVIKADGSHEMRKFVTSPAEVVAATVEPTNDEIVAKATEMAKAAGKENFADFIVEARAELTKVTAPAVGTEAVVEKVAVTTDKDKVLGAAEVAPVVKTAAVAPIIAAGEEPWEQVWKSKIDGSTHATKAGLRKHHDDLDAAAAAAVVSGPITKSLDALNEALGIEKKDPTDHGNTEIVGNHPGKITPAKDDKVAADQGKDPVTGKKKAKKDLSADELKKGMSDIGQLANLITELNWFQSWQVWETQAEGDGSTVAAQLKAAIATLCMALRDMVAEETSELFDPENENDALLIPMMELALHLPADHMASLVKLATDDEAFAKTRDNLIKAGARNAKADQARIQLAHDAVVLAGAACATDTDAEKMTKAADALSKEVARGDALQKTLDIVLPQVAEIQKSVELLLKQPKAHPALRVVGKTHDTGGTENEGTVEEQFAKLSPDEKALTLIKLSQQNGQSLLSRG